MHTPLYLVYYGITVIATYAAVYVARPARPRFTTIALLNAATAHMHEAMYHLMEAALVPASLHRNMHYLTTAGFVMYHLTAIVLSAVLAHVGITAECKRRAQMSRAMDALLCFVCMSCASIVIGLGVWYLVGVDDLTMRYQWLLPCCIMPTTLLLSLPWECETNSPETMPACALWRRMAAWVHREDGEDAEKKRV